jgi:hypothetical protein
MARLDDPQHEAAGAEELRRQRGKLLELADRHRWRLHRMPELRRQLTEITTQLMRAEMERRPAQIAAQTQTTEQETADGHHGTQPRYWWNDD